MIVYNRIGFNSNIFFCLFFACFFCLLCCVVDNLIGFWIFLELCGLSIVPSFFYNNNVSLYNFYSCVLSYIVISGLSSVFIVLGLMFLELYYFVYFGFAFKFGLFPFFLWVYQVFSIGNWLFIFFLSVVLKFPVLFFCFLYQMDNSKLVFVDCFLTILLCSIFIWFFSLSWEYVWCHISLSSVATLVVACFCSSFEICFFIYVYYFFWATLTIIYLSIISDMIDLKSFMFWVFCFLLLITPVSVPLIYKISVCVGILYSSVYILLIWSVYSFSEQFFLYKLASGYFFKNVYNNWLS
uniref:NADH dehydrogenase subunit 2 n=1 Tax=Hydatigera krepkogorski TaxID=1434709 RepID=N0DP54_9CEST|nr:NADH dehydrogenase subunit 2 [Hydatigera krepkogorski]BAN15683.1 NADH dehydrogenase subunit 2 [Hydatigera krepkogorski]